MRQTEEKREQIDLVELIVCNTIGVRVRDIINKDKRQATTTARNLVWYILHYDYGYSGNIIAETYFRKPRTIWKQIADMKYKIANCIFYTDLYNRMTEIISEAK